MTLAQAYKAQRRSGKSPRLAIANARERIARGLPPKIATPEPFFANPVIHSHGEVWRIIENPEAGNALRFAGYADEILRLRHTGWFTDTEFQDETARGAVWQLTGHKGKPRYLAGFRDPAGNDAGFIAYPVTDDKEQAASWADDFARKYAESESEYQAEWRAGETVGAARAEIKRLRAETLALFKAARAACAAISGLPEAATLRKALRDNVTHKLDLIAEARKQIARTMDSIYTESEAFKEGLACHE